MKVLLIGVLSFTFSFLQAIADEATKEDYEKRLARYDLVDDPGKHRTLASWCKRNYPAKYHFHQNAYNEHQFKEVEDRLGNNPTLGDLKKARDEATKLGLEDKATEYHNKWGEKQYASFAKRLKPGNVKMMKQLLTWTEKEGLTSIPSAQALASDIIKEEPDYLPARKALGHLEVGGEWKSKADLLAELKPMNVHDRVELHKILASARKNQEKSYPANPFSGMTKESAGYSFRPKKSPEAKVWIHESGYSRTKPCRLIISLHGGGSGGTEKSYAYAQQTVGDWTRANTKEPFVVICPAATKHVTDSWGTLSNVLEILNAAEEVCDRFNIDRKKIYVTGQSMGGGGTTLWYMCFPELTAASVGRAGWFHHTKKQKDCLNKPIMIIQGEKDEQFRVDSKVKFVKLTESINANLTNISHPDLDHSLFFTLIEKDMFGFFEKHTNDIAPDWDVIRAAAKAWLK